MADMSWAVLDTQTGNILGHENAGRRHAPASLAKLMTLYLTFEAIQKGKLAWDDQIVFSKNASAKIPMKLWIKPGDSISVRDAVNGMIVISANDAAAAIGEHLSGSETAFARLMTKRGRQLGLRNTIFANPSGLTDRTSQLTTARDMAVLGMALERDFPKLFSLFSQPSFVFRGKRLKGHNNLMYRFAGVDGLKTGYTAVSGYNLVSSLEQGKGHLIGVVLGGKTARSRDAKMEALLNRFGTKGAVAAPPMVAMNAPVPTRRPKPPVAPAAAIDETVIEQGDGDAEVASLPSAWQIQIGALPSQTTAKTLLGKAQKFVHSIQGGAAGQIMRTEAHGTTLYRVRFDGFEDSKAASQACAVLKRQNFDCITVRAN
ncbi:D-alanyl-D-alanine carboxypeptidase [Mesorhizobium retamae]|uniref:D-alanyl-D-alanine carboxypeptidase n=1 Tax=Mesorhizobium retamae TaxID=2912854 RepID=A0ABS9QE41_9HYPH|nr:D-alanyl-D-alanine carboxypeptidase [Mesorhizobium sp. IRAMC:0171]MCG7505687.1 D-alanyl-D-alanine carboxypeptidase [Mesorhizobium sp. IRAMC:0171]